jgi:hypothetical protein
MDTECPFFYFDFMNLIFMAHPLLSNVLFLN